MLMTMITWLYAGTTILLLGFGADALTEKAFRYRIKNPDSIFMAGIITATVYAQIFSLFYRVSLAANLVMITACTVILVCRRKKIFETLGEWKDSTGIGGKVLLLILVVIWAFFTSRGYIHYDTDLYHAQSIRWLEEYGIVPGLANLHERFAYNSSFFALSALYSLKFVLGESMHAMNGFLALILSITCFPIVKSWKRKRFVLADYARIGAIYYLVIITNEVVSPCSDYAVMLVIFFIVIKWLDALGEGCRDIAPYALLCVAGVYALTLKLTAGLILLLLIKPAYMLIRQKKVKEIFIYLGLGLLVAVPWFFRTVIISGWLLYPFTGVDLFNVDWKLDAVLVEADAMQIKTWGRALYAIGLIDTTIVEWFPNWFRTTLTAMDKLLVTGALAATVVTVISAAVILIRRKFRHLDVLLVMGTMLASYLFWQTSAPLMRYGYAYVLLLSLIVFGWCMHTLLAYKEVKGRSFKKLCHQTIYAAFLLFGIYKAIMLVDYVGSCYLANCYIWQEDYGVYELESYEINDVTFYYPVAGDRTGYDAFPASGTKVNIEFRGDTMKEGFRKAR